MYVNVFVKNIGVSRMAERLGESEKKKNTICVTIEIALTLAVNLVINQ